ncbi:MAG: MarR family winged helix-turn-helix transcriptional regulator [Motilibacteraceae bacterium]|jgi:DNA-binding MarR family transcriptional regulator|nr:MarR family transcriptional regulator [Motilibacteraceae bacterium]
MDDPIAEAHRQWVAHGWADAADGMAAVTSLVRAHQIVVRRIDAALKPLDLTFARYELLQLLSFTRTGALPMAKVGARLQVHPTSVTSAVDRLQAQGFVEREPDPSDRRSVLARITPAGRRVAARATTILNRDVFEQPGLNPEQLEQLMSACHALRAHAGDLV